MSRWSVPLLTLATAVAFVGSVNAALSAKSYISDGLIAHWDGIENVSYGGAHNNAAATWTELTGNGPNIAVPTAAAFRDYGLQTARAYGTQIAAANAKKILDAYASANYSIEIAYNRTNATTVASVGYKNKICTMLLMGTAPRWVGTFADTQLGMNPNNSGNEGTLGGGNYVTIPSTGDPLGQHSFSCVQQDSQHTVRADGTLSSTKNFTTASSISTSHGFCLNRAYYQDYGLDGFYHSIRIYDRALSADEVAVNYAVDKVRFFGADASSTTLPDGWRFDTSAGVTLEKRLAIAPNNPAGGTVSLNGAAATTDAQYIWCEQGSTVSVTLSATPAEGYVFLGWLGVGGADKYSSSVVADIDHDVTAVFRKTDGTDPLTLTWNGEGWATDTGFVCAPIDGDSVVVPSGSKAAFSSTTPELDSVTITGTLTLTNWTTCLKAQTVTIASGGILTCGAAATNKVEMSRVWVECSDLTIASGGKIDVDGKGYLGLPKADSGYHAGYGPGAAISLQDVGASHGGYGSYKWLHNYRAIMPYDDPAAPVEPGSGGIRSKWGGGGCGGGVVRIVASGTVSVEGSILASGIGSSSSGNTPNHDTAGSGGSVWIDCDTISGAGVIRADGGDGDNPTPAIPGMPGAGGCIAVHYDTGHQTAAAVAGMTISAAGGFYRSPAYSSNCINADRTRYEADIGTLHFSDAKILDALLGNGLTGQIRGLSSYQRTGDLDFTSGHVRFAEEGVNVSVSGDVTMGGTASRLEIGGTLPTNSTVSIFVNLYSGTVPSHFTVGGNLTLGGVSRLDVRAAATNTTDLFGAFVNVGGTMTVGSNCFVYAWSDIETPSAPRFDVGGLYVATGGVFSAERRGARAAEPTTAEAKSEAPYEVGPRVSARGGGTQTSGGGHGGRGGTGENIYSVGGRVYDDQYRPWLPGSGGAVYNDWSAGGYGGGAIVVSAPNGTIAVYGEINADGERGDVAAGAAGNPLGGGGSGGTIFLESRYFVGGETAVLSAKGGSTTPYTAAHYAGGGGGGRIAIWCGEAYDPSVRITSSSIVKSTVPLSGEGDSEFFSFDGVYSVAGGEMLGTYAEQATSGPGGVGTAWFVRVKPRSGMVITVE